MDFFSFAMHTTPSPTKLTCHSFACFWYNCKGWTITWVSTGLLDFICGCWALYELIHIYASIHQIKSSRSASNVNDRDLFRKKKDEQSDNYASSKYLSSFNSATPSSSVLTSPSNPSRMQLFETRKSQKLFLFIIFLEGMFRTFEFVDAPFSFIHCTMTKIDKPNLLYAIIQEIGPNLFCYAFSCLGYEMSKIYFTLTKPREYESTIRRQSIQFSLYFVITFTILVTLQSIVTNICFILYFNDKHKYKHIIPFFEALDFYSYGGYCFVLGIYFIRFAIPIYTIYKQILIKVTNEQKSELVIESSISSGQSEQMIENQVIYKNIKTKHKYKYSQSHKYQNNTGIELQTDALNYFVASMKRTWLMALYCGVAFTFRAFVLLIFSKDMEAKFWVFGPYQLLLEIVPNLMMLYIYHYSTKKMKERYNNVINR